MQQLLASNPGVVFHLTPNAIRELADSSPRSCGLIATAISEALVVLRGRAYRDAISYTTVPRRGFSIALTDEEFLERTGRIAGMCSKYEVFPYDDAELGYEEQTALYEKRLSMQASARATCLLVAKKRSADGHRAPGTAAGPALDSGVASNLVSEVPPVIEPVQRESLYDELRYLPDLKLGQFQLPNLIVRCGVLSIGAVAKSRRTFGQHAPLRITRISGYGHGDLVVRYTGEELRLNDIEVWWQLLKLAESLPLGERVAVKARELLSALHRGTGGSAYEALRGEIARLQGAVFHLRTKDPEIRKQFCLMFPKDPLAKRAEGPIEVSFQLLGPSSTDGTQWSIAIPQEVRVAFGRGISSWFSERDYYAARSDKARRLFLLYASHAKPWPFTVAELGEYLGSSMQRGFDLRRQLDAAHKELLLAGVLLNWSYERSTVRNVDEPTFVVRLAKSAR